MKHCGRDESECLFIGCNCGCPACVEVKVANGTMAKGSHANEGVRPALVRALEDVKRGNDNIEKLVAEIRQRSRERSMLMAQNERAAALVWAIRKAATGTSATHDPLWADVWNVCNAIECARDAEGAIPDEQPDREDDAHEPNEASRGY
jgi:hypothetical protein